MAVGGRVVLAASYEAKAFRISDGTSPQLGRFLLLGRGSFEGDTAIHRGLPSSGVRGLVAAFCTNRVGSTRR